jgi:reverse gyrase
MESTAPKSVVEEAIAKLESKLLEKHFEAYDSIMKEFMTTISPSRIKQLEDMYKKVDDHLKDKRLVTLEQLKSLGWTSEETNLLMVNDLNRVLYKYDITSIDQIQHLLGQSAVETGWVVPGDSVIEKGDKKYFDKLGYGEQYRGYGYIHITW